MALLPEADMEDSKRSSTKNWITYVLAGFLLGFALFLSQPLVWLPMNQQTLPPHQLYCQPLPLQRLHYSIRRIKRCIATGTLNWYWIHWNRTLKILPILRNFPKHWNILEWPKLAWDTTSSLRYI